MGAFEDMSLGGAFNGIQQVLRTLFRHVVALLWVPIHLMQSGLSITWQDG